MRSQNLVGLRTFAVLASFALGAALAGGACGDSVPSDTGGTTTSSSSGSSSSGATASSSSGGTGGSGTGGAGGSGGAPDCYPTPMTYVEIINGCTNAQAIDIMPVLPLLGSDGGLPPLP